MRLWDTKGSVIPNSLHGYNHSETGEKSDIYSIKKACQTEQEKSNAANWPGKLLCDSGEELKSNCS